MSWSPESWRTFETLQEPDYAGAPEARRIAEQIATFQPLVAIRDIDLLKNLLAEASKGEAFILQGGDCAERFRDCKRHVVNAKVRILLAMAQQLQQGLRTPVVAIGRMAGQYAKPRSSPFETHGETTLPIYRGDIVNGFPFHKRTRKHDPARMLQAYLYSQQTLAWMRSFLNHQQQKESVFTSHEALVLDYESALTRLSGDLWYNRSAHFLWLGARTARLGSSHVEYLRGIANPIGIKVGPEQSPTEVAALIETLNPTHECGKITLITRMGKDLSSLKMPPLIQAVRSRGTPVTWLVDPMHGNTKTTANGRKTRNFDDIVGEIQKTLAVHKTEGTILAGVHFELTGERATECLGGPVPVNEESLDLNYRSWCDPRLNRDQALALANELVAILK